jgi:hypothetical protein
MKAKPVKESLYQSIAAIFRQAVSHIHKHPISFMKNEVGSAAPFAVLALVGALMAISYAVDTTRMVNSSAQIKRATDAAAMAVGNSELLSGNEGKLPELQKLAYGYVRSNLGMDSELVEQIGQGQIKVTRGKSEDGVTYSVSVILDAKSALLGVEDKEQIISSTAEVVARDTEVALMIPNAEESRSSTNLSALRELSKDFLDELEVGKADEANGNVWFSLIPFGLAVNVYDPTDLNRINRWASFGALNPPELRSLFRSGRANSLADPRFPDRIADRLCMFRGLGEGENFFWDEPPTGQFGVYYLHDEPANGSPGAAPISWVGPNPDEWPDNSVDAQRWIVVDRHCPHAPLLPLTDDIDELDSRFDQMQPDTGSNTNIAIAMGWAATTLSPNMRGEAGLGDSKLPLDFDDNGNVKAMVLLFDVDDYSGETNGYNSYRKDSNGSGTDAMYELAQQRFQDLCQDFRSKDIKFFMVAVFSSGVVDGVVGDETSDYVKGKFGNEVIPKLQVCAQNGGALYAVDAGSFAEGRSQIKQYLKDIAGKIRSNYYVRLIK